MNTLKNKLFLALAFTVIGACTDGASPLGVGGVAPVTSVDVAGVRAAPDFDQSGRLSVALVPRTEEGVSPASLIEASTEVLSFGSATRYFARTTLTQIRKTASEKVLIASILLDSSGSMDSTDPNRLRVGAARQWLQDVTMGRSGFHIGVFDFGAGVSYECFTATRILQDYTTDVQAAHSAIDRTQASGGTPLYESAAEVLEDMGLRFKGSMYERVLVILSDGENNGGGSVLDVIKNANAFNVRVVSLAFGGSTPDVALSQMAQRTGGSTLTVENASDLSESFSAMAAAMRESYVEAQVQIHPIPESGESITLDLNLMTAGGKTIKRQVRFTAP